MIEGKSCQNTKVGHEIKAQAQMVALAQALEEECQLAQAVACLQAQVEVYPLAQEVVCLQGQVEAYLLAQEVVCLQARGEVYLQARAAAYQLVPVVVCQRVQEVACQQDQNRIIAIFHLGLYLLKN